MIIIIIMSSDVFLLPQNILMSSYSAQFLNNCCNELQINGEKPDISFRQNGYLFLASEKGKEILETNHQTQQKCGVDWIDLLTPEQLDIKFPWLLTAGLSLGSFSSRNEGYFDPWSLVNAFKKKAINLGVEYMEGEVVNSALSHRGSSSVYIDKITVKAKSKNDRDEIFTVSAGNYVNACGAWAGRLMDTIRNSSSNPLSQSGKIK